MNKEKTIKLIASFAITFGAAYIGSIFTTPNVRGWYALAEKPFFSPPNWLFGPVWTVLYTLMAISLYIIWTSASDKKQKNQALTLFAVQIVLNALWSFIFFELRQLWLAFFEILVLELIIIMTFGSFRRISPKAANLLIPYIAWVGFASLLNLGTALLN